jgi:hypothetical protein
MADKTFEPPDWKPLEQLVGPEGCGEFMWMVRREVALVIVWHEEIHDQTCRSTGSSLGVRARAVTTLSEAIPDNVSQPERVKLKSRDQSGTASIARWGARLRSKVNVCESVINPVMNNMPKVLLGMDQTVREWS